MQAHAAGAAGRRPWAARRRGDGRPARQPLREPAYRGLVGEPTPARSSPSPRSTQTSDGPLTSTSLTLSSASSGSSGPAPASSERTSRRPAAQHRRAAEHRALGRTAAVTAAAVGGLDRQPSRRRPGPLRRVGSAAPGRHPRRPRGAEVGEQVGRAWHSGRGRCAPGGWPRSWATRDAGLRQAASRPAAARAPRDARDRVEPGRGGPRDDDPQVARRAGATATATCRGRTARTSAGTTSRGSARSDRRGRPPRPGRAAGRRPPGRAPRARRPSTNAIAAGGTRRRHRGPQTAQASPATRGRAASRPRLTRPPAAVRSGHRRPSTSSPPMRRSMPPPTGQRRPAAWWTAHAGRAPARRQGRRAGAATTRRRRRPRSGTGPSAAVAEPVGEPGPPHRGVATPTRHRPAAATSQTPLGQAGRLAPGHRAGAEPVCGQAPPTVVRPTRTSGAVRPGPRGPDATSGATSALDPGGGAAEAARRAAPGRR